MLVDATPNYTVFIEAWNKMAKRAGLTQVKLLSHARRRHLANRIDESSVNAVLEAIASVEHSDFLCGDNERGWRAGFDFVLQPRSFCRLLEGQYRNRRMPYRNGALELLAREAEQPTPLDDADTGIVIDADPLPKQEVMLLDFA